MIKPGLYLVSTPIGNLSDISIRAIDILQKCDTIYCEDTRVTDKLLDKHHIYHKKLGVYNDHSTDFTRQEILKQIQDNKIVALVSDAGTPMISDPGYKLVQHLLEENIHIDVIPGTCALICALQLSGLPSDRFMFCGFMPKTEQAKINIFQELSNIQATTIFYETGHRLLASLQVALQIFGDRKCAVVREITKIYQTSYRGSVSKVMQNFIDTTPKGEIVMLFDGNKVDDDITDAYLLQELSRLIHQGISIKNASETLSHIMNQKVSKKYLYNLWHKSL